LIGWIVVITWLVIFAVVVQIHSRVSQTLTRFQLLQQLKITHLARLRLEWEKFPIPPIKSPGSSHPFALDLDLVGANSLHQLIDTSVSYEGSQRLADWLLAPEPDYAQIQHRQNLVRELIPMSLFRDKLILAARLVSEKRWHGQPLVDWLAQDTGIPISPALLALITGLSLLHLGLFVLLPGLWLPAFLLYISVYGFFWRRLSHLFGEAKSLHDLIRQVNAIFHHIEGYSFAHTPYLKKLCQPFLNPETQPSTLLGQLNRVMAAASIQGNPIFWLALNAVLPWDLYTAYVLQKIRAALKISFGQWMDTFFELEGLSSLANFAALNPEYTFPNVVNTSEVSFQGQQVGHPLIEYQEKVCNDFAFSAAGETVLITGSNMAGKSSFLRTLGLNVCLAYAGSAVNATHMETSLFRLFTCIRVSDSVTDGISYFYAEVKRLKALLEALHDDHTYPLFFLIDEIFRGTNNRERLIGSRAYIKALTGHQGVGAISTHDLELVKLADEIPQVINVHFREQVVNGQMVFDYLLHPGPSPTTNALKIMAMEGLPV
ncbi:MAG: hypothetical protein K8I82_05505, partial [Anaerolineae bacterium]|nr:hypothetical protein [Anaerolineae bacterium]